LAGSPAQVSCLFLAPHVRIETVASPIDSNGIARQSMEAGSTWPSLTLEKEAIAKAHISDRKARGPGSLEGFEVWGHARLVFRNALSAETDWTIQRPPLPVGN
jgi:hypothetical protein